MYPSCPPELMGDVELSDAICMTISDVLQRVPVYILECLPDPDAPDWFTKPFSVHENRFEFIVGRSDSCITGR